MRRHSSGRAPGFQSREVGVRLPLSAPGLLTERAYFMAHFWLFWFTKSGAETASTGSASRGQNIVEKVPTT